MKPRILLIDDDEDFLEMMQFMLEPEGYELASYKDVVNIISLTTSTRPDIILLDYSLRKITGGELCKQLHNNPDTENVPVVMMSAFPRCILPLDELSFARFIAKPFDLWEFLSCLDELLKQTVHTASYY